MILSRDDSLWLRYRAMTEDRKREILTEWDRGESPEYRVFDILCEISQELWFAGYLDRVEREAWELLDATVRDIEGHPGVVGGDGKVARALLDELRALTVEADDPWWPADTLGTAYREFGPGVFIVLERMPLEEWRTHVAA